MEYFARFEERDGHLFRFDTRVYVDRYQPGGDGECIAAIVGKNPGSARPLKLGSLEPLELDGDKLLPFVRNRFRYAFQRQGRVPPANAYVRVWNLFYLCSPNLGLAKDTYASMKDRAVCDTEAEAAPLTWFAWGGNDAYLNPFKHRFLGREHAAPFFYDNLEKLVRVVVPAMTDSARHTQGTPADPIESYLSQVL